MQMAQTLTIFVQSPLWQMLDQNEGCLLIPLDLLLCFDSVKHDRLLNLLERRMEFSGPPSAGLPSFSTTEPKESRLINPYPIPHRSP